MSKSDHSDPYTSTARQAERDKFDRQGRRVWLVVGVVAVLVVVGAWLAFR